MSSIAGCELRHFPKGSFRIKDAPAGRERLLAKFIAGPAMTRLDFGNPTALGGTIYNLCVYDSGEALPSTSRSPRSAGES